MASVAARGALSAARSASRRIVSAPKRAVDWMLGPVAGVPHIALPMYALAYLFVGMTVFGYAGNIYRFAAHGDPLMKGMN